MPNDLLTVVTTTVGDSADRLDVLLGELRRFTKIPFRHIVCDDGTPIPDQARRQKEVCARHGAEHFVHPGPEYGVSFNLNYAFEQVRTPWAYQLEDGLRASAGWLETALDFLEQVHERSFLGYEIGLIGTEGMEDWQLGMAGVIPSSYTARDFLDLHPGTRADFYGDWNDGYWCWPRILPALQRECLCPHPEWERDLLNVKNWVMADAVTDGYGHFIGWRRSEAVTRHFPMSRGAALGTWYPGAFMMVNIEKWRRVGRFRDYCPFFEGHLGVRMGLAEFLVVVLQAPLWLHRRSQGFTAGSETLHLRPRPYKDTAELFREDFGVDNFGATLLVDRTISLKGAQREEVRRRLDSLATALPDGWETYLTEGEAGWPIAST